MTERGVVVAIDGPAGAGKSTLGRRLARELGLPHVNTGLMYRAVAALAIERSVDPDDEEALASIALALSYSLAGLDPPELVIRGGPPASSLHTPEVEAIVSEVARHPAVRAVMREAQRALGLSGSVMEGRDIGTVVFPDATVKIFLVARPDVRVHRRELEREGARDRTNGLAAALDRRDILDGRTNPLVPAPDAHRIDTTALGPDEVLAESLRIVREARSRA